MMSGGLDSTSVAVLAARMIAPTPITTISYIFDRFPDCDERQFINAVRDHYGTHSIQIPCDDLWPFSSWPEWPIDLNGPSSNPYRLILERTYSRASDEGLRVLLTGMYGDNLYAKSPEWLADLFLEGRISQFRQEVAYLIKRHGFVNVINSMVIRNSIKKTLVAIPGMNHLRGKEKPSKWLSQHSLSLIAQKSVGREFIKQSGILNLRDATGITREIYNSNRYSIELRSPFRDRRLIEFVQGLPAYLLFSEGVTRHILRIAMTGILPEIIRTRHGKTNLLSLYNYGVQQKKEEIRNSLIADNSVWKKYINPDIVMNEWETVVTTHTDGRNTVLPSVCIFFELWYKSLLSNERFGGVNGSNW
jgi:asparagine synthase (glutamine-hydrolysing)